MSFPRLCLKLAFAACAAALVAPAQDPSPKELKKLLKEQAKEQAIANRDERKLLDIARKTFQPETERDQWLKVMAKLYPGATAPDARGEVDFGRWFDAVSQGQATWDVAAVREKPVKELFLRTAQRLETRQEPITRPMFLAYADRFLGAGNSPPWKASDQEKVAFDAADKMFKGLDRNGDGVLAGDELTPPLRPAVPHFDTNGNGAMEYAEYREYFRARMTEYRDNPAALAAAPPPAPPPVEVIPEPEAPKKEPPPNLPAWFRELDEDHDGQVGLYEWRRVGHRPLEEFAVVDGDGDGLLTPFELKRLAQSNRASPYLKNNLPPAPRK